jgi:hypothetical protein
MKQENDYYGEQNLACFFGWVSIIIAVAGIWQIGEIIYWAIRICFQ